MNMQMMSPQINMQIQQMQQMSQNQDPNAAAMYQNYIFQNLYKQELEKYQKHEQKLLNQQEQEIQQEKARLEAQLRMIEAEYESTEQVVKGYHTFRPGQPGGVFRMRDLDQQHDNPK